MDTCISPASDLSFCLHWIFASLKFCFPDALLLDYWIIWWLSRPYSLIYYGVSYRRSHPFALSWITPGAGKLSWNSDRHNGPDRIIIIVRWILPSKCSLELWQSSYLRSKISAEPTQVLYRNPFCFRRIKGSTLAALAGSSFDLVTRKALALRKKFFIQLFNYSRNLRSRTKGDSSWSWSLEAFHGSARVCKLCFPMWVRGILNDPGILPGNFE